MSGVEQARKSLIEHALNEIRNIPHYSNFKLSTYYVIAKLGLQHKTKAERLFESPVDLGKLIKSNKPIVRVRYDIEAVKSPTIEVGKFFSSLLKKLEKSLYF